MTKTEPNLPLKTQNSRDFTFSGRHYSFAVSLPHRVSWKSFEKTWGDFLAEKSIGDSPIPKLLF